MNTYRIHKKFEEKALENKNKPALIFQEQEGFSVLTFEDILKDSQRIGAFLKSLSLDSSSRVALYMENNPFWFSVYLAIVSQDLVAVPVDYMLPEQEVANILIDSEAKVIICSPSTLKNIEGIHSGDLVPVRVTTLSPGFLASLPPSFNPYGATHEKDVASLLYTSGTTDNPKAVCLSHKNLMSNFYDIYDLGFYGPKDIFLCILPLHHAYPFMVNLLVPLLAGASVVFPRSLRADDILFCLKKKHVSIFVGVPQVFGLIYQNLVQKIKVLKPLVCLLGSLRQIFKLNLPKAFFFFIHKGIGPALRFMVCGGAKLDLGVARGFFDLGFNMLEGYGLTETSPVVSFNRPRDFKIGSVGKALETVAVEIDSPDKQGRGEVKVKGLNVTSGYFRKPHLTEETIKDGWFFTKDIGFIDKQGYLHITGRKDECIVLSSGKNIWPQELENLYRRIGAIKELCIFAQNERLRAVVVPDRIFLGQIDKKDTHAQIKKDIEEANLKLAPYKRVAGFHLVFEDLPRTRLGKLKRFLIKSMYAKEDVKAQRSSGQDQFSLDVIKIIQAFAETQVDLKSSLELDLGIDSLTKLQLISLLEKRLRISISDEDLYRISNVQGLIDYLRGKKPVYEEELKTYQELSFGQILAQMPPQEILARVSMRTSFFDRILGFIGRMILLFIFKPFYRLEAEGLENIPKQGPFLVCPNHVSFFDGPLIFATFPYKYLFDLYFMGLSDYFDHFLFSWMVKPGRIIPTNANKNLQQALKVSSFLLRETKTLCVFPEGQRSPSGKPLAFRKGVGILSKELGLKIVPVAIKGAYKAWPVDKKFPGISRIRVVYGKPIDPAQIEEEFTDDPYQKITEVLQQRVTDLLEGKGKINYLT